MERINPDIGSLPVKPASESVSDVERPFAERSPVLVAADLRSLGLLFGSIYFLQAIANPLEGLATQPVRARAANRCAKPSGHHRLYGPPFRCRGRSSLFTGC